MDNYTVYKHISPSGKIYIGITRQEPSKRWISGYGYSSNEYFYKAIKKYSWKNIIHEILFTGLTKTQAEKKEIELIELYKSNQREYGYNIENGGSCRGKTSEETRRKMSELKKGEKHHFYGKKLSEETKKKMSEAHKGSKPTKGMTGKHHSEETKKRMSELKKGAIFSESHRKKLSDSHIGKKTCLGKHHSEESKKKMSESHKGKKPVNRKKVFQYNKNMTLINSYESASEAMRKTGTDVASISACANGRLKSAGGWVWRYSNIEVGDLEKALD